MKPISNVKSDPSPTPSDSVVQEWRESATYWEKHAPTIRAMFAPVTQALIQEANIREGNHVLDVAAGPGEPSLTIAQLVGTSGSVMSTDVVPGMVEAAERQAQLRGIVNIQFRQAPADSLPFADNTFDAAVCRFGVMFFPEPLAGQAEMLRTIKPGGRISLAVWGKSESNPFGYVVTDVLARHVETAEVDANAPGAFRFAEPGKLAEILTEAGAKDVTERLLQFFIEAPLTPQQFWEMRSQTSGTLREKLEKLSEQTANEIAREVEDEVGEFFPNNQMKFPGQVIIVTGTK